MIKETIVDLETCSACCLSCSFCPRQRIRRRNVTIEPKDVQYLAKHVGPGKVVWLSGLGEPLLDCPDDAIAELKGSGAKVYSNSNAAFPKFKDYLDKCVKAGLSFLNISVYGWDEESYAATSGHDKFKLVQENVAHAIKVLPTRISFVQTETSPEDVKERLSFAFCTERIRLLREHGRADGSPQKPPPQCALCQNYLFITSDGRALPCVNDVEASESFGFQYELAHAIKQQQYPWPFCHKCDCGARFASAKEGFLDRVLSLDGKA
jgi:MoaA/NifB/PqqE/SkfB family radical SAM enzyme